jgi:hypothetical protein
MKSQTEPLGAAEPSRTEPKAALAAETPPSSAANAAAANAAPTNVGEPKAKPSGRERVQFPPPSLSGVASAVHSGFPAHSRPHPSYSSYRSYATFRFRLPPPSAFCLLFLSP